MKTIPALIILLLLFAACKKEKNDPSKVTVQNLSGTYKISKVTVLTGNSMEMDVTPPCALDNTIKLNSDMTVQIEEGSVQCTPPTNYSGTWSLPSDSTIIIGTRQGTIRKFDSKNLEVILPEQGNNFVTYYVKQ